MEKLNRNNYYSMMYRDRDKTKCVYSGCERPLITVQHCEHHMQKRREQGLKHRNSRDKTACIVKGCTDELKTARFCDKHRLINNKKINLKYQVKKHVAFIQEFGESVLPIVAERLKNHQKDKS